MTVFGSSAGGFRVGKQVVPVDDETEASRRLLEAVHSGEVKAAVELLADPAVDVNFAGAVCLRSRRAEVMLRGESPAEVRFEVEELRTDVTPLFLAAHSGDIALARRLMNMGADVNQKLFKGFATTAAVREGHLVMVELLVKAGASQDACEEALLEASCHGRAKAAELLMQSDLIRHHIAVHAIVTASCRGFLDVVDALMKCGVDANAADRVLLCSSKPALHTNVDCTALVAAVVSRQVAVVRHLLQVGVKTDFKVSIGGWSWDLATGDELRVGAGLAEAYSVAWCAVEYFETTGTILRLFLQYHQPNALHFGRSLLHHAILCGNEAAVSVLLGSGADPELPVKTTSNGSFLPIHLAARLGRPAAIQCLINAGADVNSITDAGDTALMVSARYNRDECLLCLASNGADFGAVNSVGESVVSISSTKRWSLGFQQSVFQVIRSGKMIQSTNLSVFSPLLFTTKFGEVECVKTLLELGADIDEQDKQGLSALMLAAAKGNVDTFRLLVFAGANVKLCNNSGETAITLAALSTNRDQFEEVMLEFELEKGNHGPGGFFALHCAARRGDVEALELLTSRNYDVNVIDEDGYTPLMHAAREGHASSCQLLITHGARCDVKAPDGQTALRLARSRGHAAAENIILDQLARLLVLSGGCLMKHTKEGNGRPHVKTVGMVAGDGVLRWGKSSRRNVVCREAAAGPSPRFEKNRRRKGDVAGEGGVFRVVTEKGREVHFVCLSGLEGAELWVRGIKLVTSER